MNRIPVILACLLLIIAVFLVLAYLKLPLHTYLWREIHNTGHTPLFGVMSLSVLGILIAISKVPDNARRWLYVAAAATTLSMGLIVELAQIGGPGDADIFDLLRDFAGIASFLLLAAVFDHRLALFGGFNRRKSRIVALAGVVLILSSALAPIGLRAAAYYQREKAFPTLLNFDSTTGMKFVSVRDARLERTAPPIGWAGASGRVGKLTLLPGRFPGLAIDEAHPDWRGYESFEFELFSELDKPIEIWFRIDDLYHNNDHDDRFNAVITVNPGSNVYEVPLERVRRAPAKRVMDMKAIRRVMLFGSNASSGLTLYLDNFRLE